MQVAVTTDTVSGMRPAEAEKLGIGVVAMPFMIDGRDYREGVDLDEAGFYARTKASGVEYHTSQPTIEAVAEVWDKALADHDQLVHVPMSSGLSGTANTLRLVAESDRYRGRVFVPDSRGLAPVEKYQAREALTLAERGYSGQEICRILERDRDKSSIYIGVSTLEYLRKGGRLKPAAYSLGMLLRIRPVLSIINGGRLDVYAKVRTRNKLKETLIQALHEDLVKRWNDPEGGSRVIIMTEANSSVKSKVLKLLPKLKTEETDSLCVA